MLAMMITSAEAAELVSSFISGATLVVTLVASAKTGNKVRYIASKSRRNTSRNRNSR